MSRLVRPLTDNGRDPPRAGVCAVCIVPWRVSVTPRPSTEGAAAAPAGHVAHGAWETSRRPGDRRPDSSLDCSDVGP
eukprot:760756-Prymnesium_polylepis.1